MMMTETSTEAGSGAAPGEVKLESVSSPLLHSPSPSSAAAPSSPPDSPSMSFSTQPLFTLPSLHLLPEPVNAPRYHRYTLTSDSSQLVVNIPLESSVHPHPLYELPSPPDSGSQLTTSSLHSASSSPSPSSPPCSHNLSSLTGLPYASIPAAGTAALSSSSSSASKARPTIAERQARRAAKHRAIDASRRSREAAALSSVLLALGLPDPTADSDSSLPAKYRHGKTPRQRSKAKLLEAAAAEIHRLRQQALVSSELSTVHRHFFQEAPAQLVVFSPPDRRCVDANVDFCLFTGFQREEVLGSSAAMCPAPPLWLLHEVGAPEQSIAEAESGRCLWEIGQDGFDYPVPREQSRWNYQQLRLLFNGQQRRVQCVFRVALADHQLMNAQCSCWLIGTRRGKGELGQYLVVQTTAEKYRRVGTL